ncbi:MAG: TonB-dependent receptor [Cyclobacteriaceae bacterium]|nr:TonB-dependent receptor [Cyclobacteriaceae bacterium]
MTPTIGRSAMLKATLSSSKSSSNSMVSAFANVNYTFNEKYILAATLRTDGSSRFINNRFGTFGGISGAWRISMEPFLTPITWISDMKLRASYGATGNNEVVGGDYPGFSSYGTSPGYSSYPIDGTLIQGFAQVSTGNPDLKWETNILTNLALDVTLGGKFYATVEWYNRKTNDMIFAVNQPLETGNIFPINQNIGSMVNKGIDMQISYRAKTSRNFSYNIGLTGTHYTNKVLSLDANDNTFVDGLFSVPTRTQPGYRFAILWLCC